MNIKHYLCIEENHFIIQNDFLFIYHHEDTDVIINHITKEKFINKRLTGLHPLSYFFNIPINPNNYNLILKHNDYLIYKEFINNRSYEPNLIYCVAKKYNTHYWRTKKI